MNGIVFISYSWNGPSPDCAQSRAMYSDFSIPSTEATRFFCHCTSSVGQEGIEHYMFSTPIGFFARRNDFKKCSIGLRFPYGSVPRFLWPIVPLRSFCGPGGNRTLHVQYPDWIFCSSQRLQKMLNRASIPIRKRPTLPLAHSPTALVL